MMCNPRWLLFSSSLWLWYHLWRFFWLAKKILFEHFLHRLLARLLSIAIWTSMMLEVIVCCYSNWLLSFILETNIDITLNLATHVLPMMTRSLSTAIRIWTLFRWFRVLVIPFITKVQNHASVTKTDVVFSDLEIVNLGTALAIISTTYHHKSCSPYNCHVWTSHGASSKVFLLLAILTRAAAFFLFFSFQVTSNVVRKPHYVYFTLIIWSLTKQLSQRISSLIVEMLRDDTPWSQVLVKLSLLWINSLNKLIRLSTY